MNLNILSPKKDIFSGKIKEVYVPTDNGEYGIFENHSPMILNLSMGEIKFIEENGKERVVVISEGIVDIKLNDVNINVLTGLYPNEIDIDKLEKEKAKLEEKLKDLKNQKESKKITSTLKLHSLHISSYNKHVRSKERPL